MSKGVFLSLPALYGGPEQYLTTLKHMVDYLSNRTETSRDEFINWGMKEYPVSNTTVKNYLQALARLGITEKQSQQQIYLTKLGQAFSRATDGATQAQVILKRLFLCYQAFQDTLLLFFGRSEPLSLEEIANAMNAKNPQWNSDGPISERIQWLMALKCITQVGSRRVYELTELGRRTINQIITSAQSSTSVVLERQIIQDLYATARRSEQYWLFEEAIARAFRYLGFEVIDLGKRGETDLLVRTRLGSFSYSFIAEARTQKDGKVSDVDSMTILKHRREQKADFAVVVAEDFVGNNIKTFASENNIVLLSISILEELILLNNRTPLQLIAYRRLFEISGVVLSLPQTIQEDAQAQARYMNLSKRLINFLVRAQKISPTIRWTAELIHSHIAMEYHEEGYSQKEIEAVLAGISSPLIPAIYKTETSLVLAMSNHNLALLLRNLADLIEQS